MPSSLWRTADIEIALAHGALSVWQATAYAELKTKVLDEAFPCTFGTVAQRKGAVLFNFVETLSRAEVVEGIHAALVAYTDFVRPLPLVTASLTPLAIFIPPPRAELTIEGYFEWGWQILQAAHDRDPSPWPAHVPRDPDDPAWSFCFGGVPLFVNFKTPAHQARRSRRMARSFMLLIQCREGFDLIAGDTPQGRHARALIRHKLAAYDAVPMYPELSHYGHAGNREWKQYFVPETNAPVAEVCPFHPQMKSDADKRG
jgi:N-omega-hydroxy-L-arginine synthase